MDILTDEPLAPKTTFKLGGPARYFCSATSVEELRVAHYEARTRAVPLVLLGGGSNVLVSDRGVDALVVHPALQGITYEEVSPETVCVIAGAGESWDVLVADTVAHGLWGLENLSLIPGSVGATPIQNVGAYGVEVKDTILWVEVYDPSCDEVRRFYAPACAFGYRDSFFKHEGVHLIITRVAFLLSFTPKPMLRYKDLAVRFGEGAEPTLHEVREAIIAIRTGKFPDLSKVGTAGSFFKNPTLSLDAFVTLQTRCADVPSFPAGEGHVKVPAAFLLERCGWKGVRRGTVGTWAIQPLVLVHYGGGTTRELLTFADEVAHDVQEKTGVLLEREVRSIQIDATII